MEREPGAVEPRLGAFDAAMVVVSLVIGIGIFRTPAMVAAATGSAAGFFGAWAGVWREQVSPAVAEQRASTALQAPGLWRSNGPLSNLPAFSEVHGCKAGNAMFRADADRAPPGHVVHRVQRAGCGGVQRHADRRAGDLVTAPARSADRAAAGDGRA